MAHTSRTATGDKKKVKPKFKAKKKPKLDKFRRFDYQESQGKMEHPRLVSVAEDLVPNLLKPKSKTGGKLLAKLEELKGNQKREERKEQEGENDQEVRAKEEANQPKQKQMLKETDPVKPAKTVSGKKPETKAESANTTETPTGCTVAKNNQTKRKGECD